MTKRKAQMSRRELWLVAMLPAALVVIVSMGWPNEPVDQIPDMERRLAQLTTDVALQRRGAQLRELTGELAQREEALAAVETREAQLEAQIASLNSPGSGSGDALAQGLDELTRRLAQHDVQVLEMAPVGGSRSFGSNLPRAVSVTQGAPSSSRPTPSAGSTPRAPGRSSRRARASLGDAWRPNSTTTTSANLVAGGANRGTQRWRVVVAATWGGMIETLSSTATIPSGLSLTAIRMEPARSSSPLRRWELTIAPAGGRP